MADDFKVFWQPGCSSCLRAKEFLAKRGIGYESINVRARPEAMEELASLGAQSVPVVAQGKRFVFAQDLGDLARFIGVELDRTPLPAAELVRKIDLILAATQRYLGQFPAADLEEGLPGRERTILDLGYHIFVIPARPSSMPPRVPGSPSTISSARRAPTCGARTGWPLTARRCATRLRHGGAGRTRGVSAPSARSIPTTASTRLRACWSGRRGTPPSTRVSSWRSWSNAGSRPTVALGDDELDGLPLPEEVYDDEVALEGAAGG